MKRCILLFVLIVVSCTKKEPLKVNDIKVSKEEFTHLYGNWIGDFIVTEHDTTDNLVYSNKINILIKKIEGNIAYGQSIVAGNSRPLKGKFDKNKIQFILEEPGDDKYDGKFEFSIKNGVLKGNWFAFDSKLHVTGRKFELRIQEFKYNSKLMLPKNTEYIDYYSNKIDSSKIIIDGIEETIYDEYYRTAGDIITTINASETLLTEEELKNLKKLEIEIIRNTIYARHGYTFKKKSFRQFFDPVGWYVPISENVSNQLTSLEKENIKLLNRFEKYAEDNYDTFGR